MTVGLLSITGSLTGFNGGLTQTNTNGSENPGVWPFINFIKTGSEIRYLNAPTDATAPKIPILELDSNGYPTTLVAGTGGYFTGMTIPNSSTYSGKWVLTWSGTGTVIPANFSTTTTLSTSNRLEFLNNDNGTNWTSCSIFVQAFSNSPNHVTNLKLFRIGDEALVNAGQLIFPDHLTLMKSAKPGAIRSLGWGGSFDGANTALIGLWAQRRPTGYITYGGYTLNPNFFPGVTGAAGTTTRSGTDYTLAYSGFTLADKEVVHLIFDSDVPHKGNSTVSIPWSTTNTVAINVNWTAHGLAVGNTLALGNTTGGNVPPAALVLTTQQIYFVSNVVDANNFNISATSGGASIVANATTSGNMFIATVPRININSTGFVTMTDFQTPIPTNIGSICGASPAAGISTIIYDATTGWFHVSRSGPGLMCGVPPEIFVDYCAVIGSNPWMVAPFMSQTTGGALGGCTDYMPSWVTYAKNTYPWMKPIVEAYNETWNPTLAGLGTFYATTLAYTLWPTQAPSSFVISESYGKWVSDIGQAISAVFGNDRTKYSMICMGQAVTFHSAASLNINDSRLTSALYVSVSGGQPAYKWADRVGAATYFNPQETDTAQEIIDAFNYVITNAGNSSAQSVIAEAYAATANSGVDTPFTLTYVNTIFTNIKAWGLGQNGTSTVPNAAGGNTVKGMVAYEGGYGPDVPVDHGNGSANILGSASPGITQANPCVLTIDNTAITTCDGVTVSGNPGAVGAMVNIKFASGITQINNSSNGFNSTFTNTSASIAATNTLIANQAIMFTATPPTPFAINVPYYVISTGLSGSAYQLSATRGGSAIVAGANGSNISTQEGWFITAVGSSTITLDLDSTGFSAWTNASQALVTFTGSGAYVGTLRIAGSRTSALGTCNTGMYTNFFALGGGGFTAEYPSNFLYFGNSGSWSILNPNIYAPLTAQWNSIVAEN